MTIDKLQPVKWFWHSTQLGVMLCYELGLAVKTTPKMKTPSKMKITSQ